MAREHRYDFGGFSSGPQTTPQGFLRLRGNLTRVGVLTYHRADGSKFRELRLPEEVFRDDSLHSLAGAPVTDLHPKEMVGPSNVSSLQKGYVEPHIKHDGRYVQGPVIVQDAGMIQAVKSGDRRELSPGYFCEVELHKGEWRGEKYDGIQRNIQYNHLGIGPEGWGRSGAEVALKLDGGAPGAVEWRSDSQTALADLVLKLSAERGMSLTQLAAAARMDEFELRAHLDGAKSGGVLPSDLASVARVLEQPTDKLFELVPLADRATRDGGAQPPRRTMEFIKIRIDGIDYEVPVAVAPHITKALESQASQITALQAKSDAQEARADAAEKARDEAQAKLDSATDPKALAEKVRARVELENRAAQFVSEPKFDGLEDRAVKVMAITAADADFKEDGKSDEYVNVRFDLLKAEQANKVRGDNKTRQTAQAVIDPPGKRLDAEEIRIKANEELHQAWQKPLAASRQSA